MTLALIAAIYLDDQASWTLMTSTWSDTTLTLLGDFSRLVAERWKTRQGRLHDAIEAALCWQQYHEALELTRRCSRRGALPQQQRVHHLSATQDEEEVNISGSAASLWLDRDMIRLDDEGDRDDEAEIIGACLGGQAIQGGTFFLDQAFALYRALSGSGQTMVKEEQEEEKEQETAPSGDGVDSTAAKQTVTLNHYSREAFVQDIHYSHDSIKRSFNDGRSYEALIGQLNRGEVDPLQSPGGFLRLQVWRFKGKLISQNNRRLFCLKRHQEHRWLYGDGKNVLVRVDVTELPATVEKFCSAFTTRDEGRSVRIRGHPFGSADSPATKFPRHGW